MGIDLKKAVFTSVQVIVNLLPILYVFHDDDDEWQFLSGTEIGSDEEIRIISMGQALKFDATLNNITSLPIGSSAYRREVHGPWEIEKHDTQ